jgi:hypothetical protein
MWGALKKMFGGSPSPPEPRPPEVLVDAATAEVRFNGVPQWRIEWAAIREVAVEVSVVEEVGYSEAFWQLTGGGVDFGCPVELVAGADEFNARVFALPGFDHEAYRQAREAEAAGRPGRFVCWQAAEAEPGAAADGGRETRS